MGAWGYGSFENDDAADWIGTLAECDSFALVRSSLETAIEGEEYLECDDGAYALAAAETVAAALGKPHPELPEEIRDFLVRAERPADIEALRSISLAAVQRVRGEQSELAELMREGVTDAEDGGWELEIEDLVTRLHGRFGSA